jgi:NAD(P)-dependent dehydrogenase (short-subunit alcohol dehydrogenase family)
MNILVVGGNGGIGQAIVQALCEKESVDRIIATYHRNRVDIHHDKLQWLKLDVTETESLQHCWGVDTPLDYLIYAVGSLHSEIGQPEKSIRHFNPELFLHSMQINTLPLLMLAKYLHPAFRLSSAPRLAAISARVGSIAENRKGGWYSYRTSKAALNMALKTLSVEWRIAMPRGSVAALHPGTTDTGLSLPFQASVPEGQLFTAQRTADQLLSVLEALTPDNSGNFWSWDGTELPW